AIRDGSHVGTAGGFGLGVTETNALIAAANDLLAWFDALYLSPRSGETSAWVPSQLEYQFLCATDPADTAQTVLTADRYAQGHLDWYSFDIDNRPDVRLGDARGAAGVHVEETLSFLPVSVTFGGMPSPRYWEIE